MLFSPDSALSNPLAIIQHLRSSPRSVSNPEDAFEKYVARSFREVFNNDEAVHQIPSITHPLTTPSSIAEGSLVRFRCMIQDTGLGTELYASQGSSEAECSMYRENLSSGDPGVADVYDPHGLQERELFYGVEIPGEAAWVRAGLDGPVEQGLQYALGKLDVVEPGPIDTVRKADVSVLEATRNKYPLRGGKHVGALLKLYDSADNALIKTSGTVEAIGVFGWTPFRSERNDEDLIATQSAIQTSSDNTPQAITLIPCIHVIFCRPPPVPKLDFSPPVVERTIIRDRLLDYLTKAVFHGDDLAAQYLLAALTAKIHTRVSGFTIGALPLDLVYRDDPEGGSRLPAVVASLVPRSTMVPLTIGALNERPLFPVSNADSLHSGALQLSPSTLLVLDSRGLAEGQLSGVGVKNVEALQKVISDGKLIYSFPYSAFEFEVDMGLVALSHGSKTFLSGFWSVPVQPSRSGSATPCPEPTPAELHAWRGLIDDIRSRQIAIPESLSSEIQDTFVSIRRTATTASEADKAMSQEDLGQRLELSRLLGLQMGKSCVELEDWQQACKLEKLRKIRLSR